MVRSRGTHGGRKYRCKALEGKTEGSRELGDMFREQHIIKMYPK